MKLTPTVGDLDLGVQLFMQLAIILVACRVFGYLGKRFLGQAQVVSEMITGVFLGPSVLGAISPQLQQFLFPKTLTIAGGITIKHPSMQILYAASQVGLALYMFIVGVELDTKLITKQRGGALLVSLSGIAMPFILGFLLSTAVAGDSRFYEDHVTPLNAGIYMGAAMCITAFPMLARIIYELNLSSTPMGVLALSAGAFDDVMAWTMLAIVISSTGGKPAYAIGAIGGGFIYALVALIGGKHLFAWFERIYLARKELTLNLFASVLMVIMVGAFITDSIRLYAVFGAFLLGMAMPKGQFAKEVTQRMEQTVVALLLPLFFIYSGLNTQIGLVNTPQLWMFAGAVLACAVVGKGVACMLASKFAGQSWAPAAGIGILMNSRGLMELIILNIGLEQHVIKPTLFTIMVLMAIVTTLMTSPLFEWLRTKRDLGNATEIKNATSLA